MLMNKEAEGGEGTLALTGDKVVTSEVKGYRTPYLVIINRKHCTNRIQHFHK
jgi:hypothetical protein